MVDIRCPSGPGRLLGKLHGQKLHVVEGNLIELACQDCKRLRRQAGESVSIVLHRYDLTGALIETVVKAADE